MATQLAILATAKAIRRLLAEAGAGTEFSGADFKVIQAAELTSATPPLAEGISICLYQITANTQRKRRYQQHSAEHDTHAHVCHP